MAHPSLVFPAAEKVSSLGKDWHKFCLKCERCNKTLTPGGHAEVRVAGADGVGELCCHAGVAWWSLWGSPALQGWGVPGIGLGQVPDAVRMGCPCGTQAQERPLCLQMLLLLLPPGVRKSSDAQSRASHRAPLAPRVVPQLCHPSVGSPAACGGAQCALASTRSSSLHRTGLFRRCAGFEGSCQEPAPEWG